MAKLTLSLSQSVIFIFKIVSFYLYKIMYCIIIIIL